MTISLNPLTLVPSCLGPRNKKSAYGAKNKELKPLLDEKKELKYSIDSEKGTYFQSGNLPVAAPAVPIGSIATRKSIYQSRSNFGVNFGSCFVLEKWIFDKFFINNTGYELDAIRAYINAYGVNKTKSDLEDHWNNYCTDDNWNWLKSKGITAIRIPIGYWHVNGGQFTSGTSFEGISQVYANAWNIFLDKYIKKAANYNIGVLVDLHAVPKGANTDGSSGEQFGSAGFWNDSNSQKIACNSLKFMAGQLNGYDNIIGLQVVNEAVFDNTATAQKAYYTNALKAIREANSSIPVIISDGWWTNQWIDFINSNGGASSGLVIDTHIYRCYSDSDKSKSVNQIISELPSTVLNNLSGSADILIGEYCCVLDTLSWNKTTGDKTSLVKQYGNKEVELFKERANSGYYFWCFKFQIGDGGEWGLVPMINGGAITVRSTSINIPTDAQYNQIITEKYNAHVNYWKEKNSSAPYQHWRYKDGFGCAWYDSLEFLKFDNSRIGRLVAWKHARRQEHINEKGSSDYIWEWESGFDEAIKYLKSYT